MTSTNPTACDHSDIPNDDKTSNKRSTFCDASDSNDDSSNAIKKSKVAHLPSQANGNSNAQLDSPSTSAVVEDNLSTLCHAVIDWNSQRSIAIVTIQSRGASPSSTFESDTTTTTERKCSSTLFCLVGRAKMRCLEHSFSSTTGTTSHQDSPLKQQLHILGFDLMQMPIGSCVELVSPSWSSWCTCQIDGSNHFIDQGGKWIMRLEFRSIDPPSNTQVQPQQLQHPSFDLIQAANFSTTLLQPPRPTIIPQSWIQAVDTVLLQSRQRTENVENKIPSICLNTVLMSGAKGVGKSTCLRYVTNRILSSTSQHSPPIVLLLDVDVGQPESTPPGLLSLTQIRTPILCPPYFSILQQLQQLELQQAKQERELVSSVFFGSITSKDDPNRYIQGIEYLLGRYRDFVLSKAFDRSSEDNTTSDESKSFYLLVNMDGWVKGLGMQLVSTILETAIASISQTTSTLVEESAASFHGANFCNQSSKIHVFQLLGTTKAKQFDLKDVNLKATNECLAVEIHRLDAFSNSNDYNNKDADTPLPSHNVLPSSVPSETLRLFRLGTYFVPYDQSLWDSTLGTPVGRMDTDTIPSISTNPLRFQGLEWIDDKCQLATHLASQRPYYVPFESISFCFAGPDRHYEIIRGLQHNPTPTDVTRRLAMALNGSIVGICKGQPSISTMTNEQEYQDEQYASTSRTRPLIYEPDNILECLGFGLIRSIDTEKEVLYILTPIPASILQRQSDENSSLVLVGGNLTVPISFLFRGDHAESFPYQQLQSSSLAPAPLASRQSESLHYGPASSCVGSTANGTPITSTRTDILGSEPMQSRNFIARKSLTSSN